VTRRRALKQIAGGALAARLSPWLSAESPRIRADDNLIRAENAHAGTSDWLLTKTRTDSKAKCRCREIEGYCSRASMRAGERLDIMVSTAPASAFVLDLYRLGYYGGTGGRFLMRVGPFDGTVQPDPPVGEERVRECAWPPAITIEIPPDWISGVYLGKLTAEKSGVQSYVIFIVHDQRPCDFLFQCSDTTWGAYNRWPDVYSLYDDGNTGETGWYVGPGVRAGWQRPFGKYRQIFDAPLSQGSGEFLLWEFPLAFWMEKEGYDVSYISNADTHADGKTLRRARAFLSVGHDEYWSGEMFTHVQSAVAAGVHAAFLSGNSCDGLIEFHPGPQGEPHRSFSRIGKFHPNRADLENFGPKWKRHGPDPAMLMGARSTLPYNGVADWKCVNEKHWVFEGTGMKNGDTIPGLVGWEHHGEPASIPGLEVLARGPVFSGGRPQNVEYTSTIYATDKGSLVFNAATIWWSIGLSAPPGFLMPSAHGGGPKGVDARVQKMTANLFERFRSKA
jgi:hypothetical protein